VEGLALLLKIVEGAYGLLRRRAHVEGMDEVEVQPVGAEPLQAGLDPADNVPAREASCIDVLPGRVKTLRAEDDLVTAVGDERSEDFSDAPSPWASAVSKRVDPGLADSWSISIDVYSSASEPQDIVPKQSRDTCTPVEPTVT
jgi:hypothetical protein